ncbi:MAG TPA: undecaprenyl-diphosphate phosphatase [Candidatus Obscuribacterales bacterium]
MIDGMWLIEAVVLGVVQGLTEFLPISSTAHLRVVPALLGWPDPGAAYSAAIQLGSIVAVITYFFRDLMQLLTGSVTALKARDFGNQDVRMAAAIVIGTIPICVLGLILKPVLERPDSILRALPVIGTASIVMGLLLLIAERQGKHDRSISSIAVRDGLIIGLGQALALIPGCSRSGSTLTVAMLMHLKREDAARFSFLLGVPAITLSGIVEVLHLVRGGLTEASLMSLVIGTATSTVVSYLAIAWLLKFLKEHSTTIFIIYRLVFGIAIIALSTAAVIR